MKSPLIINKPEQSGKTFTMLQEMERLANQIKQYLIEIGDPAAARVINIILCANSILLTEQTCSRVDGKFMDKPAVKFSSKSKINKYNDLFNPVVMGEYDTILCCTNSVRMEDIKKLINQLLVLQPQTRVNVWIDEIHTFYSQTRTLCEIDSDNVKMYGLTATPKEKMWKFYDQPLEFFVLQNVTLDNYHGWMDCKIVTYLVETSTIGFVEHVLEDNKSLIQTGTNWFIPAEITLDSHHKMREILLGYDFTVIVVNGSGISLTMARTKRTYKFPKDEDFSTKLSKIYKEYDLDDETVAITGNLCIGEAITIQSEKFIFNYGIISPSGNKEKDSQSAGRLKGNIKNFKNYKPCTVFTTNEFDTNARAKEQLVYELNIMASEKFENGEIPEISIDEFRQAGKKFTDKEFKNKTVPIIHNLVEEEYSSLRSSSGQWDRDYIVSMLSKTYEWVEDYSWKNDGNGGIQQIVEPKSIDNYKKHITDLVAKAESGTRAVMDRNKKSKDLIDKKQMWIYVDSVNKRFIITRWDGEA